MKLVSNGGEGKRERRSYVDVSIGFDDGPMEATSAHQGIGIRRRGQQGTDFQLEGDRVGIGIVVVWEWC